MIPYTVVVVPYNPQWPDSFAHLGRTLRHALGANALRIDHIGSTAVPGLDAKPILDVQISVVALEPSAVYRLSLENLGYIFRADNPERTKRYFREAPERPRTFMCAARAVGPNNSPFYSAIICACIPQMPMRMPH